MTRETTTSFEATTKLKILIIQKTKAEDQTKLDTKLVASLCAK